MNLFQAVIPFPINLLNASIYLAFGAFAALGFLGGLIGGFRRSFVRMMVIGVLLVASFFLSKSIAHQLLTSPIPGLSLTINGTTYANLQEAMVALIQNNPDVIAILGTEMVPLGMELATGLSETILRLVVFFSLAMSSLFVVGPIISLIVNFIVGIFIPKRKGIKPLARLGGAFFSLVTSVITIAVVISPLVAMRPYLAPLFAAEDPNQSCGVSIPETYCDLVLSIGTPIDNALIASNSEKLMDSLAVMELNGEPVLLRQEVGLMIYVATLPNLPITEIAAGNVQGITDEGWTALGNAINSLGESQIITPFFPRLITYLFEQLGMTQYLDQIDLTADIDWVQELNVLSQALRLLAQFGDLNNIDLSTLSSEDLAALFAALGNSEVLQAIVANALNDLTSQFLGNNVNITFWENIDYTAAAGVATLLLQYSTLTSPTAEDTMNLALGLAEELANAPDLLNSVVTDLQANNVTLPVGDPSAIQTALENANYPSETIDTIMSLFVAPQ